MNVSEQFDVIVIGGGAAGLMCALTAGQRGRRVRVLEQANRVGKKILISGGGRCNFTNFGMWRPGHYISAEPALLQIGPQRATGRLTLSRWSKNMASPITRKN
ncbi:MAG: FAD-dependent oxidoreductase [Candidatus Manganitrophus sp.]|nr:FAD-dependent oxidoreductase [Candidatus Manganitrophus sp.]